MKKLFGTLALSVAAAAIAVACTSTSSTDEAPKANTSTASTIALPLVTTVGGELYRVEGDIHLTRTDTDPDQVIPVPGFGSLDTVLEVEVEPGTYDITLTDWTMFNPDNVDVTADTTLVNSVLHADVSSNEIVAVTYEFIIAGIPAGVTPDAGVPNECATCCNHDADHDGWLNCTECPRAIFLTNPSQCPDTDEDGVPDYKDENSDCDDILDCNELTNEARVDDLSCLAPDPGQIDIDIDVTLDGGV